MERDTHKKRYCDILRNFFDKMEEKAYYEVSKLGKELVLAREGPDVLINLHGEALNEVIKDADLLAASRKVVNANDLLLNGIMSYAMTYYGFMDQLADERKKLEQINEDMISLQQELKEKNRRLQEASRLKSNFLASMSHELRTPLNSIIGFSGILLQGVAGDLNNKQKKQMRMVYAAGKDLLEQINDILDLSKIEAGKITIYAEEFDVHELISLIEKMILPMIVEKGLQFKSEISADIPSTIYSDRHRIKHVLTNLFSNAIKFTNQGTITVTCQLAQDKKSILFGVKDSGVGIREQDREKIFDEFQQIDSPLKEKQTGTGLGLAISRKLVNMMGGELWVESRFGHGSHFQFTIPISSPAFVEQLPSLTAVEIDETKKLVLIIDDEPQAQVILKTYLQEAGYQVIQAFNASEAKALAQKFHPFAITLDIIMPGKDGWQILEELKNNEKTKNIPVICISIIDNRDLGLSLGAIEYLVKPIEKETLINELRRLENHYFINNILIIDDNPNDVELLTEYINEANKYGILKAYAGTRD